MQNLPEHTDRRTHSRHRIRALAYVELGENNGGIVLNISEGGFGVRAAEAIQADSLSRLRFQMQYATQPVEMSGKIAWTSESRKEAGVCFTDLRDEALSEIRTWILQEVSPRRSPKQFPVARRSFGATAEKNESISDEFSRGDIVEVETQDDADYQVAGPSVIPDSKSKFSGPIVSKAPAERPEYGATLFPKAASTAPASRLPVTALPAIKEPGSVPSVSRAQNAPENWMDFRVQMGRGWMVAALVTFLVAISFSAGMAVRRGGLVGLRRNADTPPSTSPQTQNQFPLPRPSARPRNRCRSISLTRAINGGRFLRTRPLLIQEQAARASRAAAVPTILQRILRLLLPAFGRRRNIKMQEARPPSRARGEPRRFY